MQWNFPSQTKIQIRILQRLNNNKTMGKNEMRDLLADDFKLTNKQRKGIDSHHNNAWDKRVKGQLHILYRKLGAIEKTKKRNERNVVDRILRNERLAYFKITPLGKNILKLCESYRKEKYD